jgi:hypothetical protein
MPNGRSGGFIMQIGDLKELIRASSGSTFVGHLFGRGLPARAGSASDVATLVDECPQDSVAVEEQHHDSYIIHLSNEPISWISVTSGSPLFPELRRRHAQWVAEHPGWSGWIAF